jgi:hypothetical protein
VRHAEPDPVFAAIEAHKAAMAANTAALNTKDEDAEDAALEAVLTCQPTTQDGIIALLEHMSAPSEDGTVLAFAFGPDEDSPVYQAAADLPAMIAETLRSLSGRPLIARPNATPVRPLRPPGVSQPDRQ